MKKTLIVTAVLVISAVFLLFVWNNVGKNKSSDNKSTQSQQNTYIPPLDQTEKVEIKDSKNKQQIKENFDNFTNAISFKKTEDNKNFAEFEFVYANGQPVLLDEFSQAVNVTIYPEFKKYLDQEKFSTIFCLNNNKETYGLILNVRNFGRNENINYTQIELAMKEWEKKMLYDLHPLLFPKINFDEAQVNQTLGFSDGKYRFANFILSDDTKASINYKIFGSQIVITASVECMDNVSNYLSNFD